MWNFICPNLNQRWTFSESELKFNSNSDFPCPPMFVLGCTQFRFFPDFLSIDRVHIRGLFCCYLLLLKWGVGVDDVSQHRTYSLVARQKWTVGEDQHVSLPKMREGYGYLACWHGKDGFEALQHRREQICDGEQGGNCNRTSKLQISHMTGSSSKARLNNTWCKATVIWLLGLQIFFRLNEIHTEYWS